MMTIICGAIDSATDKMFKSNQGQDEIIEEGHNQTNHHEEMYQVIPNNRWQK